jgi:hypothetical protein
VKIKIPDILKAMTRNISFRICLWASTLQTSLRMSDSCRWWCLPSRMVRGFDRRCTWYILDQSRSHQTVVDLVSSYL